MKADYTVTRNTIHNSIHHFLILHNHQIMYYNDIVVLFTA